MFVTCNMCTYSHAQRLIIIIIIQHLYSAIVSYAGCRGAMIYYHQIITITTTIPIHDLELPKLRVMSNEFTCM